MKMENMGGNPGMRPSMQPGMGGQVGDKNPADASEILTWSSELSCFFSHTPTYSVCGLSSIRTFVFLAL